MLIAATLRAKGTEVVSVAPESTVADLLTELTRRGIGADIMTADVHTCTPDDTVESGSETMTLHRFRHVPVMSQGRIAGLVSIGDVVKSRVSVLEEDRAQLEAYIRGS